MNSSVWTWTIEADRATTLRADRLILQALTAGQGQWQGDAQVITRSRLQKLIEEGLVSASGAPVRPSAKLGQGVEVRLEIPPAKTLELNPEDRPLEILFQDEHLLVVNKAPGVTVHPSLTQTEGTLVHALLHHVKDLSGIGGVLRPGIVHRLDKDTSGALVISKTDECHQALAKIFSEHAIERRYWALVYGCPEIRKNAELRVESLIGRNPNDRKKMAMNVKDGRKAVTHLSVLERYAGFASLTEARLETGRTHQVRVHLTGSGHSVIGDPVYGVPSSRHDKWLALPEEVRAAIGELPGQALHARILGFDHPVTGKHMHFEAEPPAAFLALLAALRKYRQ